MIRGDRTRHPSSPPIPLVIPARRDPAFTHHNSSFPRRRESSSSNGMKQPAVYILASQRNGTLYIGVTSDLVQRVWQHKNDVD